MWHPTYSPLLLRRAIVHILAAGSWCLCVALGPAHPCMLALIAAAAAAAALRMELLQPFLPDGDHSAAGSAGSRSHSEVGDELPYELAHSTHFDQVRGSLFGC